MTNHPNRSKKLTLIRHETTGNVVSVYRGDIWLGMVYLPLDGATHYEARSNLPSKSDCAFFDTEDDAIAYLAA